MSVFFRKLFVRTTPSPHKERMSYVVDIPASWVCIQCRDEDKFSDHPRGSQCRKGRNGAPIFIENGRRGNDQCLLITGHVHSLSKLVSVVVDSQEHCLYIAGNTVFDKWGHIYCVSTFMCWMQRLAKIAPFNAWPPGLLPLCVMYLLGDEDGFGFEYVWGSRPYFTGAYHVDHSVSCVPPLSIFSEAIIDIIKGYHDSRAADDIAATGPLKSMRLDPRSRSLICVFVDHIVRIPTPSINGAKKNVQVVYRHTYKGVDGYEENPRLKDCCYSSAGRLYVNALMAESGRKQYRRILAVEYTKNIDNGQRKPISISCQGQLDAVRWLHTDPMSSLIYGVRDQRRHDAYVDIIAINPRTRRLHPVRFDFEAKPPHFVIDPPVDKKTEKEKVYSAEENKSKKICGFEVDETRCRLILAVWNPDYLLSRARTDFYAFSLRTKKGRKLISQPYAIQRDNRMRIAGILSMRQSELLIVYDRSTVYKMPLPAKEHPTAREANGGHNSNESEPLSTTYHAVNPKRQRVE